MPLSISTVLRFGPYKTPKFEYGDIVQDSIRGEVRIVGLTDAKIPWPIGRHSRGTGSWVMFGDLEKAVRNEANCAVCHWWGITPQTVTKWRKALGVEQFNAGTRSMKADLITPTRREAMLKGRQPTYSDPERNEKIRQARMGKPRPKKAIEAMRRAQLGRKPSEQLLRRQQAARERRFPMSYAPWTPEHDEIVRTESIKEAARLTGRPKSRIERRRNELGITTPRDKNKKSTARRSKHDVDNFEG